MQIKTHKNAASLERKTYAIIQDRYEEFVDSWDKQADNRKRWEGILKSAGIDFVHCDDKEDVIDFLMGMVNEGRDAIVCADPWFNDENNYGDGDGMLAIPTKLAEKILVLGALP